MWKALTSSPRDASRHHQRASLIKGLLSELNGCSARQMPRGAASKWKVTSCVLIRRHPWPLEGSATEWPHYCSLTGHPSLSASKSALEHQHETVDERPAGPIYRPPSRCWCSQCLLFNELTRLKGSSHIYFKRLQQANNWWNETNGDASSRLNSIWFYSTADFLLRKLALAMRTMTEGVSRIRYLLIYCGGSRPRPHPHPPAQNEKPRCCRDETLLHNCESHRAASESLPAAGLDRQFVLKDHMINTSSPRFVNKLKASWVHARHTSDTILKNTVHRCFPPTQIHLDSQQ